MRPLLAVALLLPALAGCPTPALEPVLEPAVGPQTGYARVVVDVDALGLDAADVVEVRVGGQLALEPQVLADGRLSVLQQGSPEPGLAELQVATADSVERIADAFEFLPPADPAFARVASLGASLTQGVTDATPTFESVLAGPSLGVARGLGAWISQPLLKPGLFPQVDLSMVGPAPECRSPAVVEFITDSITDVLVELSVPGEPEILYSRGRADPDMEVRNVASGNFKLGNLLEAPRTSDFVETFLGHLSYEPDAEFGEALKRTQIEVVDELEPTLLFTTDAYGNDALGGFARGGAPDLEDLTQDLQRFVELLAATGAECFIADLPDPGVLPSSRHRDPAYVAQVSEGVHFLNAVLATEADRYDNVYVVPFAAETARIQAEGLVIGDGVATVDMLGGLLSFDGLHFSATGYALLANVILQTIDEALGTSTGRVDIEAVFATDIHAPHNVLAAGRDPSQCE